MITVVYDPLDLVHHPDGKVSKISEYPQLIQKCLKDIGDGQLRTIFIANSVILQWLKNMASRFPQGTFTYETIDARGALSQRWGLDIPETVTNEEIMQVGLLSSDIHPQPGFSFEDTLLAHYYAPIITTKTFPTSKLASLLETVDPQKWKDNLSIPLLARTLRARMEEWKSKARSSDQRQLVEMFSTNPQALKHQLISFRVLRAYPAIGDAVLGASFDFFRVLKLPLEDLKVEESKIPQTIQQMTYFLKSQQPQNSDDLAVLLDRTSGLLTVEFETIEKHLRDHPDWISAELMDQIEHKFSDHIRRSARRIKALREMIRPAKPSNPDPNWDAETMLAWATDSYLPYQAWCDRQEQFDPDLYVIADRFSEWLISKWDDLHANSKRMVFNILPNKAAELKRAGIVNLVLVIDNLAWAFSKILRDLFQDQGYFLAESEPYLAMLPTETEISKKCLLSGAVGHAELDNKTYTGIIEKGWVPFFNDQAFRYISDIGSLDKIEMIDASTYVVNYLAVDKALHKSADEIGMPHREHIHHLLGKLVENTMKFIDKHDLRENIRIHVVSDHGSTRIPIEQPNDLDMAFFKTDGFEERSHRYLKVSNDRFEKLADNLRFDCYFLPANKFRNDENYLCARRGNRFIATDKRSYVHGGLLPEEVVVPYMVFEPATVPIQDLTVILKKTEFRYRPETVELEIGNPNHTAVEQILISILNGNVESEPERIATLNSNMNITVQIKARFKSTNIPEEQNRLRIKIRFGARGEPHVFEVNKPITMKKMVDEISTDIFDF
jgi:hypothetical protein